MKTALMLMPPNLLLHNVSRYKNLYFFISSAPAFQAVPIFSPIA